MNKMSKYRIIMRRFFLAVLVMLPLLCLVSCSPQKGGPPPESKSVPEVTPPESPFDETDAYFALSKDELLEKFGPNYETVFAGAEGTETGYYYGHADLTFVFSDDDRLSFILCGAGFELGGVRPGMDFTEIKERLGSAELKETFVETPDHKAYEIEYISKTCIYSFMSNDKDGSDSTLTITRK